MYAIREMKNNWNSRRDRMKEERGVRKGKRKKHHETMMIMPLFLFSFYIILFLLLSTIIIIIVARHFLRAIFLIIHLLLFTSFLLFSSLRFAFYNWKMNAKKKKWRKERRMVSWMPTDFCSLRSLLFLLAGLLTYADLFSC